MTNSPEENKEAVNKHIAESRRMVKMVATDAHPHIKAGEIFDCHPNHEKQYLDRKWAILPGTGSTKTKGKGATEPKATEQTGADAAGTGGDANETK